MPGTVSVRHCDRILGSSLADGGGTSSDGGHNQPASNALQHDIISTIGRLLAQEDLKSLREASASFRAPLADAITALRPRSRPTEELCSRYPQIHTVSMARHKTLCADDIRALSGFSRLAQLSLAGSTSKGRDDFQSIFQAINELTSLTALDLRGCNKLNWSGLSQLTGLEALQVLNCTGVKYVAEHYPGHTLHLLLSRLRTLVLGDGCTLSYVDDDLLTRIGHNATGLTNLDCSGCIDITDMGLQGLSPLAPSLLQLSLQSCVRLSQHGISSTMAVLTSLTSLNLRGCLQLFDDGLANLSVLTQLSELVVQGCSGIRGAGFAQLKDLKKLRVLNAKECGLLDSLTGVAWLSTLHKLNLSRCMALKPDALIMLGHLCNLEELEASGLILPGRTAHTQELDSDLERWLCVLTKLKKLDLAHFQHSHGVPQGLLSAVSYMTQLTSLSVAGMNPPLYTPPTNPTDEPTTTAGNSTTTATPATMAVAAGEADVDAEEALQGGDLGQTLDGPAGSTLDAGSEVAAAAADEAAVDYPGYDGDELMDEEEGHGEGEGEEEEEPVEMLSPCSLQLSFLAELTQLVQLDLSGWTGLAPCALVILPELTRLRILKLNRLSNDCYRALQAADPAAAAAAAAAATAAATAAAAAPPRHWWDIEDHNGDGDGGSDDEEERSARRSASVPVVRAAERTYLPCTCYQTRLPGAACGPVVAPCCCASVVGGPSCGADGCPGYTHTRHLAGAGVPQRILSLLPEEQTHSQGSMASLEGHLAAIGLDSNPPFEQPASSSGPTSFFTCDLPTSPWPNSPSYAHLVPSPFMPSSPRYGGLSPSPYKPSSPSYGHFASSPFEPSSPSCSHHSLTAPPFELGPSSGSVYTTTATTAMEGSNPTTTMGRSDFSGMAITTTTPMHHNNLTTTTTAMDCINPSGMATAAIITTIMNPTTTTNMAAASAASAAAEAAAAAAPGAAAAAFRLFFNQQLIFLSYLPCLEELHMEACVLLDDAGLVDVVGRGSLPLLRTLNLGGCRSLTGSSLTRLATSCPTLHSLCLEDCPALEEHHLIKALPLFTSITTLQLGGCRLMGDKLCEAVDAARMSQLRTVGLRGCTRVTSTGVVHLSTGAPCLTSLNLSQCWAVDDTALLALASTSRCLTHLDLKHCWRVSRMAVAAVAASRPLLSVEVVMAAWPLSGGGGGSEGGSSEGEGVWEGVGTQEEGGMRAESSEGAISSEHDDEEGARDGEHA